VASQELVKYWLKQVKRAGKRIPLDIWQRAEDRLAAREKDDSGKDKKPVVNDFRNHYESSRAYLDQREASFKVLPAAPYRNDEVAIKTAECEKIYLETIWREQECQIEQSQKLDSSLIRNVGYTMVVFDPKKWMPAVKYLSPRDVRIDPDCRGIPSRMNWWAYREYQTMTEFRANHSDIIDTQLETIRQKGESNLDETDKKEIPEGEIEKYILVCVWHIFAKNSAAMIEKQEEETKPPMNESLSEKLKLHTPTRYIQIVEGISTPLIDSEWPFLLDHNEHLLTILTMNKEPESIYGYTDYQQMSRMDSMKDDVMTYIEADAFYSSIRKYLGGDDEIDRLTLDEFMNSTKRAVLWKMLDEQGKPKLQEVSLRQPNAALAPQYDLMHNEAMKASGLSELMADTTADLKEVTAIGVRFQEQKLHQRVNLRLGGPRGYEKSIQEDAVKLLEIAHQLVPRYSVVLVRETLPDLEIQEGMITQTPTEILRELPWEEAQRAILSGGKLVKLGADAIVGADLAQYWRTSKDVPIEEIRLSTKISVVPGSTRSFTQEQQAEEMAQMFINILWPTVYQPMNRIDLAKKFIEFIGQLKGVDNMEDYLPQDSDITQFIQQMQQGQQQQMQVQQQESQNQQTMVDKENQTKDEELKRDQIKHQMELQSVAQKTIAEGEKHKMNLEAMKAKQNANIRVPLR